MKAGTWLSLLICVNVVLVTALVLCSSSPTVANAQGTGLAGNYVVVSGRVQAEMDALYLIDLRERTLHTFYYQKGTQRMQYAGYRNLEIDFRNN